MTPIDPTRRARRRHYAAAFALFAERCFVHLHPGKEFLPNWHHQAIDHVLGQIRGGETNRLIINIQPRSLKSLIVSVAYPAFVLGHDPKKRIYVISYGDDLADRHSSDFSAIVESDWYQRVFRNMRIKKGLGDEVTTTERGYRTVDDRDGFADRPGWRHLYPG